jgi:acetyl esterase/lipase
MKFKIFVISLFIFSGLVVQAQKKQKVYSSVTEYQQEEKILYRDAGKEELDEYAVKNCQLDIYYPVNQKGFASVVWFHGGGLSGGSKEIPEILKNRGFAVVAIEYRKSPEVKCPVYIEDAAAAVAWVFNNMGRYGGDTTKIFLSGHSAGGYLDLMLGMDKRWLAAHGIDAGRIAGLLPLSPQVITHFKIRKERGIEDTEVVVDEYAPIHYISKDLPPLVIITGDRELELLGRYEENAYFVRMMKLVGNTRTKLFELDGLGHSEMKDPGLYLMLKELKTMMKEFD